MIIKLCRFHQNNLKDKHLIQIFFLTCTTLTTKNRDTGRENITKSSDPKAIALAKIPGPSSQAKIKYFHLYLRVFESYLTNRF